jgi:hypothetical protein
MMESAWCAESMHEGRTRYNMVAWTQVGKTPVLFQTHKMSINTYIFGGIRV